VRRWNSFEQPPVSQIEADQAMSEGFEHTISKESASDFTKRIRQNMKTYMPLLKSLNAGKAIKEDLEQACKIIDRAEADKSDLLTDLEYYGAHTNKCKRQMRKDKENWGCICGLNFAIAKAKKQIKKDSRYE